MSILRSQLRILASFAKEGDRLVLRAGEQVGKGTVLWAGLGNRSGLHDYAETVVSNKWDKSGKGLVKKLLDLPSDAVVDVMTFRNKTRDRGSWVAIRKVTVAADPRPPCYHLETKPDGYTCAGCDIDLVAEDITAIL